MFTAKQNDGEDDPSTPSKILLIILVVKELFLAFL